MTDTVAPVTEPRLSPMFATGAQPVVPSHTEPNPAPIFDTGPHPDPLPVTGAQPVPEVEPISESGPLSGLEPISESDPTSEWIAVPDLTLEPDSELGRIARDIDAGGDLESHAPTMSAPVPRAFSELENVDTDAFRRALTGHLAPVAAAHPVVVPGAYQFVKRWKFALIALGVWVLAAAAGVGFYYWWYTALDKTLPVFGILLYLMVCMVASMLVSMVPNRPQVTALAIALMSAPLASTAAAAVLHGAYFFEWIARPG